jgi:ubiquinone/menaquinone biosynthesis C-methylase UbiE
LQPPIRRIQAKNRKGWRDVCISRYGVDEVASQGAANGAAKMRAWIYNRALLPLTSRWYEAVLKRVPKGARMLDVGIGTGGALLNNKELLREKGIRVVGIDIDPDYVRRCRKAVEEQGLEDLVDVQLVSIYSFKEDGFDAVYFSASFMLLPEPKGALRHVCSLLSDAGRVYFTQTIEERRSLLLEKGKPLLKILTTIDFGKVTYESDFLETVDVAGLEVLENTSLGGNKSRSSRLFVGQPRA